METPGGKRLPNGSERRALILAQRVAVAGHRVGIALLNDLDPDRARSSESSGNSHSVRSLDRQRPEIVAPGMLAEVSQQPAVACSGRFGH